MQENDEKGRMGRGRRLESRTKACILNPLWKAYSWGMGMERPWEATPGQSLDSEAWALVRLAIRPVDRLGD